MAPPLVQPSANSTILPRPTRPPPDPAPTPKNTKICARLTAPNALLLNVRRQTPTLPPKTPKNRGGHLSTSPAYVEEHSMVAHYFTKKHEITLYLTTLAGVHRRSGRVPTPKKHVFEPGETSAHAGQQRRNTGLAGQCWGGQAAGRPVQSCRVRRRLHQRGSPPAGRPAGLGRCEHSRGFSKRKENDFWRILC